MDIKKNADKKGKGKKLRFFHKTNRYFTGFLLNEGFDFYTIELATDVAGLNAVWYAGETVMWSKDLISIVNPKSLPRN